MPPGLEPGAAAQTPSCYRHPGRETHLRCTRCDRYICPDCMVQASVGFQCPECVRSGNRDMRTARTAVGSMLRPSFVPVVTYTLIALNVVMFGLQHIVGTTVVNDGGLGFQANMFDIRLELIAKGTWVDGQPIGVANGEWYRLVTAMFLHAGVAHIFMNMLSLYFIGPMLEALIGRLRFALVYLAGGLAGSVTSYWFMSSLSGPSLGASGAISAVFGCLVVIGLRRRILNVNTIIVVLALNIIIPLQDSNIDWRDHLGGVVAGALMGAVFAFGPEILRGIGRAQAGREQQRKILNGFQFGTVALVVALAAGATALHTSHLNDPASRTRSTQDSSVSPYPHSLSRP